MSSYPPAPTTRPLNERQREILRLRAIGLTDAAIAKRLGLPPKAPSKAAMYLRLTRGEDVAPRRPSTVAPTRLRRIDVLTSCRDHQGATVRDVMDDYGSTKLATEKHLDRLKRAGLVDSAPLHRRADMFPGGIPHVWTLTKAGADELRRLEER